ncbi:histidine phosphatase family protein [Veronia nyctiphanis]|uniref:Histidine phosphatase family protein n=1 Tax=Veronia nyctiphanis TaxID=1278244 RepID=A0A4Q0YPA0_9GAMM|nr:histidine phosphatase family protein [Veronia nyctiphanis]RXJ72772.1 histidine phosphatase family protein [Veronia nyctiphanis]
MPTKLHIFRHGETEFNLQKRIQGHANSPLTSKGRNQAADARTKIKNVTFDAAYSSDSGRAHDTACILLEDRQLSICTKTSLREIHFGDWEEKLLTELQQQNPDMYERLWNQPDQFINTTGETFAELRDRARKALAELASNHPDQNVLIVSHAGFIKTVMNHFDGRPLSESWEALMPKTFATALCLSVITVIFLSKFFVIHLGKLIPPKGYSRKTTTRIFSMRCFFVFKTPAEFSPNPHLNF